MRGKWLVSLLLGYASAGLAAGPRFVTGSTYANPGTPMAFYTSQLQYRTDPGAVSATVTHAQGEAVVAAAAGVWNVAVSSLQISSGGQLAEHISNRNVSFGGPSVVFPADASSSNWQSVPIAVIFDTDGSVTDLLLGQGASDPGSCRQNEVTESVDAFGSDGTIHHAMLIVNGRCVVNSANSLKQMQYVLMRMFGRVLGLGWSQLNDNVFTGSPTPTLTQMAYWPVMHPIDVVCGSFTYLCMQNPFTLREDDLASLTALYPVTASNQRLGQTLTANAVFDWTGFLRFPNVEGMDGVNVVLTLRHSDVPNGWQSASGVTGARFVQNFGNPVTGSPAAAEDSGLQAQYIDGMANLRLMTNQTANTFLDISWESINPLYTGAYAIGNLERRPTQYAGTETDAWTYMGYGWYQQWYAGVSDAGACSPAVGTESAPAATDETGWWNAVFCDRASPAWNSVTIAAGRSWTIEVTAQDENGLVSTAKAEPVVGVWKASDPKATLPTVASQAAPMNSLVPGMTQLTVNPAASDTSYRVALADLYGNGRPDFRYGARILYAANVAPATLGANGGSVIITGTGFAAGNRVLVNGVLATVASCTATTIVAAVPSASGVRATAGVPVDVEVLDPVTGGSTTIQGGLSYTSLGTYSVAKVSAPASLETGLTAAVPFAVKVLGADGVTVITGARVQFVVAGAHAAIAGTGANVTSVTNTQGIASVLLAGMSAGAVTVSATELSGGSSVQISVADSDPVRNASISTASAYVASDATVSVPITFHAAQDGVAAGGVPVAWSVRGGASLGATTTVTGADGATEVSVSSAAMASGAAVITACAWNDICATWTMNSVDASLWTPVIVSGAGQSVGYQSALAPVVVRVTDGAGDAILGATVIVSQTVTTWEGACPVRGRCASSALLASARTALQSGPDGLVSIAPLSVEGTPEVVNLAVTAGTNGFVSLSLVKTP